jgi:hypothetical protein
MNRGVAPPPNYDDIKTIHLAAKLGRTTDVQRFLSTTPELINTFDEYDNTPLYYACTGGHIELVTYLSIKGARDDQFHRCLISALNLHVRGILRRYNTYNIHNPSKKQSKEQDRESKHKICSMVNRILNPKKIVVEDGEEEEEVIDTFNSMRFGGKIHFILNQDKKQKVYKCHLYVLLCRWKRFALKYLLNNEIKKTNTHEEIKSAIEEKLVQLKEDPVEFQIQKIRPEIFETILSYLYEGTLTQNDGMFLFCDTDNTSTIALINELVSASQALGINELTNTILDECMHRRMSEQIIPELKAHKKIHFDRKPVTFSHTISFVKVVKTEGKKKEKASTVLEINPERIKLVAKQIKEEYLRDIKKGVFFEGINGIGVSPLPFFEDGLGGLHATDVAGIVTYYALHALPDLKIVADDDKKAAVLCHWDFVVYRSDFFRVALTGSFSEAAEMRIQGEMPVFRLDNCSSRVIGNLMEALYCEDKVATLYHDTAAELLFLGMRFDLPGLSRQCEHYIERTAAESIEQAIDVMVIADLIGNAKLKDDTLLLVKSMLRQDTQQRQFVDSNARREYVIERLQKAGILEEDLALVLSIF